MMATAAVTQVQSTPFCRDCRDMRAELATLNCTVSVILAKLVGFIESYQRERHSISSGISTPIAATHQSFSHLNDNCIPVSTTATASILVSAPLTAIKRTKVGVSKSEKIGINFNSLNAPCSSPEDNSSANNTLNNNSNNANNNAQEGGVSRRHKAFKSSATAPVLTQEEPETPPSAGGPRANLLLAAPDTEHDYWRVKEEPHDADVDGLDMMQDDIEGAELDLTNQSDEFEQDDMQMWGMFEDADAPGTSGEVGGLMMDLGMDGGGVGSDARPPDNSQLSAWQETFLQKLLRIVTPRHCSREGMFYNIYKGKKANSHEVHKQLMDERRHFTNTVLRANMLFPHVDTVTHPDWCLVQNEILKFCPALDAQVDGPSIRQFFNMARKQRDYCKRKKHATRTKQPPQRRYSFKRAASSGGGGGGNLRQNSAAGTAFRVDSNNR